MLEKIISDGQTGVDRGALDAAITSNFPHGGWCVKGSYSESGTIPEKYELTEIHSFKYQVRTEKNVVESDGTVIITLDNTLTRGSTLTKRLCEKHSKSCLVIVVENGNLSYVDSLLLSHKIYDFIIDNDIKVLNVAGTRKSKWEDGGTITEGIIMDVIRIFGSETRMSYSQL